MKVVIGAFCAAVAWAQPPAKTVLDGAYTKAQAARGESAYQANCGGCHGETLDGRAMGPLRGDKFMDRWREESLTPLFDHIKTRMPTNAAGSLSANTYLDILAFVLQANDLPAGSGELTLDTVGTFKLVGKQGPKPLPSNTLVAVIGCFVRDSGDAWLLMNATEPVRTRQADEITGDEKTRAGAQPLGTRELQLANLEEFRVGFNANSYRGQKVEAKGVLFHRPDKDRIHVLALETVAANCGSN